MCEIENENAKVKDKSGDANDEKVAACQLENLAMKTFQIWLPFLFLKREHPYFVAILFQEANIYFSLNQDNNNV